MNAKEFFTKETFGIENLKGITVSVSWWDGSIKIAITAKSSGMRDIIVLKKYLSAGYSFEKLTREVFFEMFEIKKARQEEKITLFNSDSFKDYCYACICSAASEAKESVICVKGL